MELREMTIGEVCERTDIKVGDLGLLLDVCRNRMSKNPRLRLMMESLREGYSGPIEVNCQEGNVTRCTLEGDITEQRRVHIAAAKRARDADLPLDIKANRL